MCYNVLNSTCAASSSHAHLSPNEQSFVEKTQHKSLCESNICSKSNPYKKAQCIALSKANIWNANNAQACYVTTKSKADDE